MTPDPDKAAIEALGWDAVEITSTSTGFKMTYYSAQQGNFTTPWRSSWSEVLADVRAIKEPSRKET